MVCPKKIHQSHTIIANMVMRNYPQNYLAWSLPHRAFKTFCRGLSNRTSSSSLEFKQCFVLLQGLSIYYLISRGEGGEGYHKYENMKVSWREGVDKETILVLVSTANKSASLTLCNSCLKVHVGVSIVLCIFWDPPVLRINCLVIRD